MFYLYRFLNDLDEVIYVGKAKDLTARLKSHNHLPTSCYDEISKIEYSELEKESEQVIYEIYYINLLKPRYNVDSKSEDDMTIRLPDLTWHTYENDLVSNKVKTDNMVEDNIVKRIEKRLDSLFYFKSDSPFTPSRKVYIRNYAKVQVIDGWVIFHHRNGVSKRNYFINDLPLAFRDTLKQYNEVVNTYNLLLSNFKFQTIDFEG